MDSLIKLQLWTHTFREYVAGFLQYVTQLDIPRFLTTNRDENDLIVESYIHKPAKLDISNKCFATVIKLCGQHFKEIVFKAQSKKQTDCNINEYFRKVQKYCPNVDTLTLTDINIQFINFDQATLLFERIKRFNYIIKKKYTFENIVTLMKNLTNVKEINFIDVKTGYGWQIFFNKTPIYNEGDSDGLSSKLFAFLGKHKSLDSWFAAYNNFELENFQIYRVSGIR